MASHRALGVAVSALFVLGARATVLWWPVSGETGLQIADNAPLYFTLSAAYLFCAGPLGVGLWRGTRWAGAFVYAWSGVLTALGTSLLLFDPFGRDAGGRLIVALEILGVVALVWVIKSRPRLG